MIDDLHLVFLEEVYPRHAREIVEAELISQRFAHLQQLVDRDHQPSESLARIVDKIIWISIF